METKTRIDHTFGIVTPQLVRQPFGRLAYSHLCLEAGKQIDQKRMTHRIGHFEDSLFAEQRLDLVAHDDVALFERLDGKVLACRRQ